MNASDFEAVFQAYAPLAGLLIVAFMMGILWQRVKALELAASHDSDVRDRLIKMEVGQQGQTAELGAIKVQIEGIHREINEWMRTRIRGAATLDRA